MADPLFNTLARRRAGPRPRPFDPTRQTGRGPFTPTGGAAEPRPMTKVPAPPQAGPAPAPRPPQAGPAPQGGMTGHPGDPYWNRAIGVPIPGYNVPGRTAPSAPPASPSAPPTAQTGMPGGTRPPVQSAPPIYNPPASTGSVPGAPPVAGPAGAPPIRPSAPPVVGSPAVDPAQEEKRRLAQGAR